MSPVSGTNTGTDLHIYVKDADEKIRVISGTMALRIKDSDSEFQYADINNGLCIFPHLAYAEYECLLPYAVQKAKDMPFCIVKIESTEQNPEVINFTFDSDLILEMNTSIDRTGGSDSVDSSLSYAQAGERVYAQLKNAGPGVKISSTDPQWKMVNGEAGVYEGRFVSPGRYGLTLAVSIEPNSGRGNNVGIDGFPAVRFDSGLLDMARLQTMVLSVGNAIDIVEQQPVPVTARNFTVSHARKVTEPSEPMGFFVHLLNSSKSIEFSTYQAFVNSVLCAETQEEVVGQAKNKMEKLNRLRGELTDFGVGAYELLKTATEAFLLIYGCVTPAHNGNKSFSLHQNLELGDYSRVPKNAWTSLFSHYLGDNRLPYIKHIIESALPEYEIPEKGKNPRFCTDILIRSRVNNPCFMELIWNYWHEEAMLVQTINAISRRFQNLRAPGERDPLAHVEIDPLRPLNNILWGYVEEERDRLSIKRRAYEYQHQYGLELYGKAVSNLRPADTRSKFLEAFHNLLNKCADYFRAKQDTTVDPDGYPMLHAIQELNLILAQGAHNQFGDLAWTSRVEMLMQEWILSRPEIRDFLQSRVMVPHKEAWMPQVDTMKTLQGWSDVAVTHFRDLGVLGEQILLTIRWHNWYEVTNEDEAKGWADLMRPYIQSYIHAYRAVTGVDLSTSDGVDYTMPSVLLRKRLAMQHAPR